MRPLIGLLVLFGVQYPVGWYPAWSGREPIRFCITREAEPYRLEAEVAFRRWSELMALPQAEVADCELPRTVAYRVARLQGPYLGTAYGPPPVWAEPWAGDVLLNQSVDWAANRSLLLPVLMHETAHAVGMPESLDPLDISYSPVREDKLFPSTSERRRMRCLYEWICR